MRLRDKIKTMPILKIKAMANISKEQWKVLLKSTKFFEIFDDHEIDKIATFCDLLRFPMHKITH
jgi:hypothetical protein